MPAIRCVVYTNIVVPVYLYVLALSLLNHKGVQPIRVVRITKYRF